MNTFFSASLGVSVCALALLLVYRLCERRLDSSQWSLLFFTLSSAFLYLLGRVFAPVLLGLVRGAWGLLPAGFSPSLRSPLREVAAAWRPGPLEIMTWVWLAGLVLCLLWNIVAIARVQRRVRRESRPAGEAIQKALVRVSRAMDRNCLLYTSVPLHRALLAAQHLAAPALRGLCAHPACGQGWPRGRRCIPRARAPRAATATPAAKTRKCR